MNLNLGKINVVDLEATCWNSLEDQKDRQSEITEIGIAVLCTETKSVIESTSLKIKVDPESISDFCTNLTGITKQDARRGIPLADACQTLKKKFGAGNRVWISCGLYDRVQFQVECMRKGIKNPWSPEHYNIKTLMALRYGNKRTMGMMEMLKFLNIPHTGRHHSGEDDAYNTAKIVARILWDRQI